MTIKRNFKLMEIYWKWEQPWKYFCLERNALKLPLCLSGIEDEGHYSEGAKHHISTVFSPETFTWCLSPLRSFFMNSNGWNWRDKDDVPSFLLVDLILFLSWSFEQKWRAVNAPHLLCVLFPSLFILFLSVRDRWADIPIYPFYTHLKYWQIDRPN